MGNGAPIYYNQLNALTAPKMPSTVHVSNTSVSMFFRKYLLQRIMSVYKFSLPDTWASDYFQYTLFCEGFLAVVNTNKFGVIPQQCGLMGYDVFYRPTNAIITNPLLTGILEPKINVNCTIIRLMPDYGNVMDIVGYYADMMSLCVESIGVNLVNSKLAYVFTAKSKTHAESMKKLYDELSNGNPAVVLDAKCMDDEGKPTWEAFENNLRANYIAGDIMSDLRKLNAMFDTEIGIPNTNIDKKERMITDEVESNNIETYSKASLWLSELQDSIRRTNEMFNLDGFSVDWRFPPTQAKESNENENNNVNSRSMGI